MSDEISGMDIDNRIAIKSTERNLMTQYTYDDLDWVSLGESGWRRASVTLDEGDTAYQPGSTKLVIIGPGTVTYEQAPDGGIDANLERPAGWKLSDD
jgi:hypothetical protein